jgi:hypothetical protein
MPVIASKPTTMLAGPRCTLCSGDTRLYGIEAHPTNDRAELRTYVCMQCDGVQTQETPAGPQEFFL